jgi:hypothetical protein
VDLFSSGLLIPCKLLIARLGGNAQKGVKGEFFIQFSFGFFPQRQEWVNQNNYRAGPFMLTKGARAPAMKRRV